MAALAAVRESRTSFTEEKELAALTSPLVSRGRLVYVAPAHLEKLTEAPAAESIVVDGDRLTYAKPAEGVRRTLDLDAVPELRGLVEAVRGTLAGDLPGLRRYYSVGLDGDLPAWKLTLVPLDARIRNLLRAVAVEGTGASVARVVTTEADGDVSRMSIAPAG